MYRQHKIFLLLFIFFGIIIPQIILASQNYTNTNFQTIQVISLNQQVLEYNIRGLSIPKPLSDLTGDPAIGRKLVIDQSKGNCLACHQLPIPEEEFHGTIGPSLNHIASRLTPAQLRLRMVDIKQINPMSIMPSYFKIGDLQQQVAESYTNKTLLTAQEIEHIIAYLSTLKSLQNAYTEGKQ